MDEVVNVDAKIRTDRHDRLKKIKQNYAENLKERRENLRKLSSSVGRGEPLAGLEKDVLPRLYHDLRTQRVKLRIERAEAETILARRKGAPGAGNDPVRKEIAQIEDRLAVLSAGQKVLDEELERVSHEIHGAGDRDLDLESVKDDIAQMEDSSRKVSAEVEALNVELQAPPASASSMKPFHPGHELEVRPSRKFDAEGPGGKVGRPCHNPGRSRDHSGR